MVVCLALGQLYGSLSISEVTDKYMGKMTLQNHIQGKHSMNNVPNSYKIFLRMEVEIFFLYKFPTFSHESGAIVCCWI